MTWRFFTVDELRCKESGACRMDAGFMARLDALREAYGGPLVVSSGYRAPSHSAERGKAIPGAHTLGMAADLAVQGADAHRLLGLALQLGFTGIGIQQKGAGRFIHVDTVPSAPGMPRPGLWSY